MILGFFHAYAGRAEVGVGYAQRGVELDPASFLAHYCLANALHIAGRHEEVIGVAEKALAMSQRHAWALSILSSAFAAWGKPEEARAVYRELAERSTTAYVQPSMLCSAAADVIGVDEGIAIARRAIDDRDPFIVVLARTWPGYATLRTDPRFGALVRQLELPNHEPGMSRQFEGAES